MKVKKISGVSSVGRAGDCSCLTTDKCRVIPTILM